MPYESGLIGYAAFASLALAVKRHRNSLGWCALPPHRILRVFGWSLLILSGVAAVARLGLAVGVTAWIGQMCVAAPLLVLALSWRPRLSAILAGAALVCALVIVIL